MTQAPEWLDKIVADGLSALLVLRLERTPAADTINAVADVWLHALMHSGTTWSEALDAPRVEKAFSRLTTLAHTWPSPSTLLRAMPAREPQLALPPPRSNAMPPGIREQIAALTRRQRGTAPEVDRHQLLTVLRQHIGATNGASAEQLARALNCNARHIRALVTDLRMDGEHVCGTPGEGSFMANTADDVTHTCEFLKSRALKSLLLASRRSKIAIPDLVGQMKLPT